MGKCGFRTRPILEPGLATGEAVTLTEVFRKSEHVFVHASKNLRYVNAPPSALGSRFDASDAPMSIVHGHGARAANIDGRPLVESAADFIVETQRLVRG